MRKRRKYFYQIFLILLMFFVSNELFAQVKPITKENIKFIKYPGFPDQHSTWNDIGYSKVHNKIFIGVTNHKDNIALFEYDVAHREMKNLGFLGELSNLRKFQWQGKVHSKIMEGADGKMYFATDGGEVREEYLMNNPQGYAGGFFFEWDPKHEKLTNLGMGLQYDSLKDLDIDTKTGTLYAITYPQAHFLVYKTKENELRDFGRLASAHVPRVLFTDQWGNCYYTDWRQRLVKYEVATDQLVFAKDALPYFSGTPGAFIVTGITSYAKDHEKGIIYLITYGAQIIAFHPKKEGIGKVEDLGGVFEVTAGEMWRPYVPNLNIGNNGKLYYIIGGHGNFVVEDKTVMIEFDPKTKEKKILYEYPIVEIVEATGSDIKDKDGNLYFAGRRTDNSAYNDNQEFDYSKPFMIKFNPDKEVE